MKPPTTSFLNGSPASAQLGLTLVEMMVGTALGVIVVGAMVSLLIQQRQAFRTIEGLTRLQENAGVAIEQMLRDGREAGMVVCGSPLTANTLRMITPLPWWADTEAGLVRAFDGNEPSTGIVAFGTAPKTRVEGTDALLLLGVAAGEDALLPVQSHTPANTTFMTGRPGNLQAQDIVMVCDSTRAALLQVSSVTGSSTLDVGYGSASLNCTNLLGAVGAGCATPSGHTYQGSAFLVRWDPSFWYVGHNDSNGRSLFRIGLQRGPAGAPTPSVMEMIRDVTNLQLHLLTRDTTQGHALAGNWIDPAGLKGIWNNPAAEVVAAQVRLTLTASAGGNAALVRDLAAVILPRQRTP